MIIESAEISQDLYPKSCEIADTNPSTPPPPASPLPLLLPSPREPKGNKLSISEGSQTRRGPSSLDPAATTTKSSSHRSIEAWIVETEAAKAASPSTHSLKRKRSASLEPDRDTDTGTYTSPRAKRISSAPSPHPTINSAKLKELTRTMDGRAVTGQQVCSSYWRRI
jgi:hypothetical protein